jgi:hypothetical protein
MRFTPGRAFAWVLSAVAVVRRAGSRDRRGQVRPAQRAPGITTYMAQMDRDWDKTKSGGKDKPGYVQDATVPSVD